MKGDDLKLINTEDNSPIIHQMHFKLHVRVFGILNNKNYTFQLQFNHVKQLLKTKCFDKGDNKSCGFNAYMEQLCRYF